MDGREADDWTEGDGPAIFHGLDRCSSKKKFRKPSLISVGPVVSDRLKEGFRRTFSIRKDRPSGRKLLPYPKLCSMLKERLDVLEGQVRELGQVQRLARAVETFSRESKRSLTPEDREGPEYVNAVLTLKGNMYEALTPDDVWCLRSWIYPGQLGMRPTSDEKKGKLIEWLFEGNERILIMSVREMVEKKVRTVCDSPE